MKIKVKVLTEGCMPVVYDKGEYFDLRAATNVELHAPQAGVQYTQNNEKFRDVKFDFTLIPLGFAMELPDGYEAEVVPRSSTYKKWYVIQTNSKGVIDKTYCGDTDEWKLPVVALNNTHIKKGDKICQFRIQLSQKATVWQKIKWLFTSKIEFVPVKTLGHVARGGFGTSGTK